jgi:hypothetical protein
MPEIPIINASMRFRIVVQVFNLHVQTESLHDKPGNYGIADSARKGYHAPDDAPSPHAVRLYVRRINSAALACFYPFQTTFLEPGPGGRVSYDSPAVE